MTEAPQRDTAPAVVCPYCSEPAVLATGREIYPLSSKLHNKKIWVCWPCLAWVGCHDGTETPLGRLANKELRHWKMAAHDVFDPLWKAKMERERCSKSEARNAAYGWLADQLGIPVGGCHIGMFDVEQCQRVVKICEKFSRAA